MNEGKAMSISDSDLDHWRQWIGRRQSVTERIEPVLLDRYAAAIGEPRDGAKGGELPSGELPSLAHWAFFLAAVPPGDIGADGHPKRGGFLPPITLERRMFAASDLRFHRPLREGKEATRHAEILSLTHKVGRKSGDLLLLDVGYAIEQGGDLCIEERQTIVYRGGGPGVQSATPPVEDRQRPAPAGAELWTPGPVELFRFSAVTFNSHRIHYDLPYATEAEGYPGLVVHGPFTAARLHGLARRLAGPLGRFSFRAEAPLFAGQPVWLVADAESGEAESGEAERQVVARRADGAVAMTARYTARDTVRSAARDAAQAGISA